MYFRYIHIIFKFEAADESSSESLFPVGLQQEKDKGSNPEANSQGDQHSNVKLKIILLWNKLSFLRFIDYSTYNVKTHLINNDGFSGNIVANLCSVSQHLTGLKKRLKTFVHVVIQLIFSKWEVLNIMTIVTNRLIRHACLYLNVVHAPPLVDDEYLVAVSEPREIFQPVQVDLQ